jgi:hypothetical protein
LKNDVTITHKDYDAHIKNWSLVDDVCAGQDHVKKGKTKYLPMPNAKDQSSENLARYDAYLKRAIFYGITKRTLQSLTGSAFKKEPTLTVPTIIQYVDDDIDGSGLSIYQQSQKCVTEVLKKGRTALFVDYPQLAEGQTASIADLESGNIRPIIIQINAENVTYWETKRIGSKCKLSLVVIKELAEEDQEGFGYKEVTQYRVLRFSGAGYTVEIWRKNDKDEWILFQPPMIVLSGSGQPFTEIPFIFVGSNDNAPNVDYSPMLDIANVNIGHYINSADYEQLVFFCGQVQPWINGLSEQWRDWLHKQGVVVGAGSVMLLPENAQFQMTQASPNSMAKEAMNDKERMMIAMGARLLEKGGVVKTATQSQSENETEHSVLSLIVQNVSEAYEKCLDWMLQFVNVSDVAEYEISKDFTQYVLDAQMLSALVALYQSGKYPEADFWEQLKKYGLIDPQKNNESIKEESDNSSTGLALND